MSEYIVSARKYRPESFATLYGQDNIARTLKNSILRGKLAHAYLFCGPRGVGKTSAARIFAKSINCSNPGPDMEPCGECDSCRSFREGNSYCIHELDAASNNGVDDIKALMEQVQIPPQVGKYSVYIIDEVHMLTQSAFNAFLKTLEEPPAHAIFILATTEKHKIIPTILSRCQTYDFNRITIQDMVSNLRGIAVREGIAIDDESLHIIAQKADGAMRDALTIFDQTVAFCGTDIKCEDVMRNLNVLDYEYSFKLVDAFLAGDYASALLTFDEILRKGFNAQHFVAALSSHLRDLLVSRSGGLESLLDLPDSLKRRYADQAGRCSLKFLYDALGVTTQCEGGYRAASNQRLHVEFALMKLSFMNASAVPASVAAPASSGMPSAEAINLGKASASGIPSSASVAATASTAASSGAAPASASGAAAPISSSASGIPSSAAVAATAPASVGTAVPVAAMEPSVVANDAKIAPNATNQQSFVASEVTSAPAPAPAGRRRTPKAASALSLTSLMEEEEIMVEPVDSTPGGEQLPDDEWIRIKWKELAAMQKAQPRLASALAKSALAITVVDGYKLVEFSVVNEAQKKWIEERILRNLEDEFRKLLPSSMVRISPVVTPEEEQAPVKYMPSEKAEDLISRNEEVRNLVVDLGLDIK